MTTKNGNSTTPSLDPLISSSVATTSLAVDTKLGALLEMVSSPSPSTGNTSIDRTLDKVRAELDGLTTTQSKEQEEIKKLLEETLNREVWEQLAKEIEVRIQECIDNNVAGLVEDQLNKYVPKDLRDKADTQRAKMQSLHADIHNTLSISEARRANSSIRTQKQFNEQLQHLINDKGTPSGLFPKTVNELLEMEDVKVLDLVRHYGMKEADPKSRTPNINWFLRYVGVAYQYVYRGPFRPFPP